MGSEMCIRDRLNSIHDEMGNQFACWFSLDLSLEIAVQINRSKGMYKGRRRKEVCHLFGRQKHMHIASQAPQLPPIFELTFTSPPKNEKPLTAKKLPPFCVTAKQLPPNKYRHILVYRFRQSRYRQNRKKCQPPENYRRMAIPPRLCPPKKPLLTTTLNFSWVVHECWMVIVFCFCLIVVGRVLYAAISKDVPIFLAPSK